MGIEKSLTSVLQQYQITHDKAVQLYGLFEEADHPVVGRTRMPRHPARFGSTPAHLTGASPSLGEHTDEILAELGRADKVDALRAAEVVF